MNTLFPRDDRRSIGFSVGAVMGVLLLMAAGCASQPGTPADSSASDGDTTNSRMAPTQSNQATGTTPRAGQAAPSSGQPSDGGSRDDPKMLPRMGPTQNTTGTGRNPDAVQ